MKRLCYYLPALLMLLAGASRVSAQEVIAAAGTELTYGEGAITFTVGEAVVLTEDNDHLQHTVGFHQVYLITTPTRAVLTENFTLEVFPNPVGDYLQITTDRVEPNLMIRLYDAQGRFLRALPFTSERLTMDVASLSRGSYIVSIVARNQFIKSFTILKP